MKSFLIENTDLWRINRLGNGLAYEFCNKKSGKTVLLQGDDAEAWGKEYESMIVAANTEGMAWYEKTWNECLTHLCEDYLHD